MLPFFGFTAYQSSHFGVLQHISLTVLGFCSFCIFCWCLFFSFGSRFAVYSETSGSHLREFTARWYSHLFLGGCNFVGQQFLCNSSSCEGGVILPPFFLWTYFFPQDISWVFTFSHVDAFASFPLLTAFRGKWFALRFSWSYDMPREVTAIDFTCVLALSIVRLMLVYSMIFRSNFVHVFQL